MSNHFRSCVIIVRNLWRRKDRGKNKKERERHRGKESFMLGISHLLNCKHFVQIQIQWNLSDTDTLGTKILVPISEVSFFQGAEINSWDSVKCPD